MLPTMTTQPPDRKALLRTRNIMLKDLAKRVGVSRGHMTRVVAGERRSPRLQRLIARLLDMPVRKAFPEWYSERAA